MEEGIMTSFLRAPKLAIFDVAGTTVMDDGLVIEAFIDAFQKVEGDESLEKSIEVAKETMGQRKIDVFRKIFSSEDKAQLAHHYFLTSYLERVKRGEVVQIPGVESVFRELRKRGIRVALNTGFTREILNLIIDSLDWQSFIDYSIASSEVENGRPAPDMINELIFQHNLRAVEPISANQLIVVGDTIADMQAATNAKVELNIGITSGIHTREQLLESGAKFVIENIYDITSLDFWKLL